MSIIHIIIHRNILFWCQSGINLKSNVINLENFQMNAKVKSYHSIQCNDMPQHTDAENLSVLLG